MDESTLLGVPKSPSPLHWRRPKLTGVQRDEIRHRFTNGETVRELAGVFGVSTGTIRNMVDAQRGY